MYKQEKINPYGQGEKAEQVEQMFNNIAPTYDKLNHFLSWAFDKYWRRQAIKTLQVYSPQWVLDVATGTGDFAIYATRVLDPSKVIACDISEGMMEIGREKVKKEGLDRVISFDKQDCLNMSYPNETFDAVITAFGIRNFADLDKGLREMHRVLNKGGHISILELTSPIDFPMKQLFRLYSHTILPFLGRLISKDASAYTYLTKTIEAFPQGEEMVEILKKAGFKEAGFLRLTFGICTMYYGLIGYPLGHSFSISYFNQKFADEGINAKYENFEIPSIDELPEILAKNPDLKGLNVTIPYKEKVIPFLDQISPEARAIGAVNVIRVTQNGNKTILKGFNSDVIGFTQSIEPMIDKKWHKKALILGTGGASKAINFGLKSLGLETVFVSRYERPDTIQYDKITPEVVKEYNVIINCTPVGMYPKTDDCPNLPYEAMDNHTILYDLIYNPDQTLFMRKGAAQGADVKNGLEMLLLQAFASWEFWNGKEK